MDKQAAGSYIFAKASGILGKSYIGERTHILFEQKNLHDLWTLLFRTTPPMMPEVLLARQIEIESLNRFINQYTSLISCYDEPDSILTDQLFLYEAENLKEMGAALCNGEKECPAFVDLGRFSQLRYSAWPDIKAITKKSIFSWYDHVPDAHAQQKLEFRVDSQIVRHLWQSLENEKGDDYAALMTIYKNEYVVKNVVWALRLRLFYDMSVEEVSEHIMYFSSVSKTDPLAGPVLKTLEFPLDDYNAWASWKYAGLINPHTEGSVWTVNPSWIEKKSRLAVNKLALTMFHQYPMSLCSLIAWYKIKHFELNCIRTAVESLRLDINSDEAMDAVGIDVSGGVKNG